MSGFYGENFGGKNREKIKINPASDRIYLPLVSELKKYLEEKPATYGIYFKDLQAGKTFGINDCELFPQASCIKVAYVLYLYEKVAAGIYQLEQRLSYRADTDYSTGSGYLQYFIKEGNRLTLRALAKIAITLSDNIAYRMIKRFVEPAEVIRYMKNLGGTFPRPDGEDYTTPRDMGCYLQGVLDFAYREPELGKMLLDDLTHPVWHFGLPGLLPDEIKVAHKEGDLEGTANDVGIILPPDRPYLLAVLSKNQPDIPAGFWRIATISKLVFDYQRSL